jgi:hypothetical protein
LRTTTHHKSAGNHAILSAWLERLVASWAGSTQRATRACHPVSTT